MTYANDASLKVAINISVKIKYIICTMIIIIIADRYLYTTYIMLRLHENMFIYSRIFVSTTD